MAVFYAALCSHGAAGDRERRPHSSSSQSTICPKVQNTVCEEAILAVSLFQSHHLISHIQNILVKGTHHWRAGPGRSRHCSSVGLRREVWACITHTGVEAFQDGMLSKEGNGKVKAKANLTEPLHLGSQKQSAVKERQVG